MTIQVDRDVIIIGAGAAGIGAGLQCRALGLDALILEGSKHIGGRARTNTATLGQPFDIGASFIHAVDRGNPFADIALTLQEPVFKDKQERRALAADGSIDTGGEGGYLARRAEAFDIVERHLARTRESMPGDLGLRGPWAHSAAMAVGSWLCGSDNERLDAADWYNSHSGEDWLLPNGYGHLVNKLAVGLNIWTHIPVEAICAGNGFVELQTTEGYLRAHHVILTVSIGVLQAETIKIEPVLPEPARMALGQLQMGNLTKFGFELKDAHPAFGINHFLQLDRKDPALPLYFSRPAGASYVMSFMGGHAVASLFDEGDAAVIEAATRPLRETIGETAFNGLCGRTILTRWHADRWTHGSYSNALPGGHAARTMLREPWHERIHYAGEASAPSGWQATVAGAYLAGRHAADAIADRFKR